MYIINFLFELYGALCVASPRTARPTRLDEDVFFRTFFLH